MSKAHTPASAISAVDHPNPFGLDQIGNDFRNALDAIPWIDKAFPMALIREYAVRRPDNSIFNAVYPWVYTGENTQPVDIGQNDSFIGYSFSYPHGRAEAINTKSLTFRARVSVICWCNQEKAFPGTGYDRTEQLIFEALRVIELASYSRRGGTYRSGQELRNIYRSHEDIYKDFKLESEKPIHVLYPRTAFRLEYDVTYTMSCHENN